MGRHRKPSDEKKVKFSLSIRKGLLDELKKQGQVSVIIEKLVEDFLRNSKN